jgi:hypothetical protein
MYDNDQGNTEKKIPVLEQILAEDETTWSKPMTLEEILAFNDQIRQRAIAEGRL